MIGNWFFVGSGTDLEEKLQVDEIFEHSVGFKGREFTTYLTSLEPIPITKQILERNGFLACDLNSCTQIMPRYLYNDNTEKVKVCKNASNNWDIYTYSKDECIGCFEIKYIHQLQNLLNLCGIEFEIKA